MTTVLIGKHVYKYDTALAKGIKTLPVILGRERSRFLNQERMLVAFGLLVCLVLTGTPGARPPPTLLALPKLWQVLKIYNAPPPEEAPPGYPLWPLWYVAWAFLVTRRAGALLVLGLVLDAFYPIHLS